MGCTAERSGNCFRVPNVPSDELDRGIETGRARAPAVDLLDEAVEDAHPVAPPKQGGREMAPDEAGSAGDESKFRHALAISLIVIGDLRIGKTAIIDALI